MEEPEYFGDGHLVCGNCCAKFHSPQELATHCFQCFENGKSRMKDIGLQDKENALINKGCDVIYSIGPENSYMQHPEGSFLQLNSMQHMLSEDYYSFFSNQSEDSSYQCKICGKVFTNYGSYRRHLRMHITGKSHACGDCGKRYFRRYLLIQHQEKAHGGTRQSIRLCHCGTWFKNTESLQLHSQKVHSKEPLQACGLPLQRLRYSRKNNPEVKYPESENITNVQINNTISEKEIIEIKHANETLGPTDHLLYQSRGSRTKQFPEENDTCWLCTICSWPLRNREEVLAHRQVCYPMVDYSLPKKKKNVDNVLIINDQHNFKSVISNHATQEVFPCDLSVKQNDMPKVDAKRPPRRGSFLCETCHKTFINRSSFLRHRRMHTGVKPCICEFCCMSFFRSESLATHQRKHSSKTEYICYKCGYQASNAFSLREHFTCHTENTIHMEQVQSNNDDQEMNIGNKILYQIHDSAHSSEEDSNNSLLKEETAAGYCKICQKTYYKVENYNRHMKLHKNSFHATQWFTCSFCGKVSSSRKDHQDHLKEHSLAAYSCAKCALRFQDKDSFSTHVLECMEGWDKSAVIENEQCNTSEQLNEAEITKNDTETKTVTKDSYLTLNKTSCISKNNTVVTKKTNMNSENLYEEGNIFLPDRLKTLSETFSCKVCSQKFMNHESFKRHMQSHKENWIRSCKYCGKYFFRKDHLHYHESTRHFGMEKNGDIFCCFYCSICYPSSASLKEHVASSHKVPNNHQPLFWEKSPNSSKEAVSKADDCCNSSSPYMCNSDSEGENPKLPRSTRNTPIDYSNKNTEFLEDRTLNGTLYMRENTLKQIKETDKSSKIELTRTDGKGFSCSRCSIVFQNTTEMLTHLQETHGLHRTDGDSNIDGLTIDEKAKLRKSQGSYKQCSRCQRQFSTHNSLLSHLCTKSANSNLQESTTSKQSQKYGCNMCLQEFPEIHMLDAHKQLAHVIMDMYECIVCRHKGSKEVIHAHMLSHMLKCGTFVTTVHTYQHDQEEQIKAQAKAKENFNIWDLSQNNEPTLQYQHLGLQSVQRTEVTKEHLQSQELPSFENNAEDAFSNNWDGRNSYKKPQDGVSPVWMSEQTINSHPVSQYPSSDVEEITVEPSLDILAIAATENGECENFSYNEETEGNDVVLYSDNTDEVPSPHLPKRPRAIVLYQRGKKIYKCEECDRVFINYSSCKRHRRQHSGVWKHECNICGRVFFRKDQRDKHLKSHNVAKSSPD